MQKLFIGRIGRGISTDMAEDMFRLRHSVICEKLAWRPVCDDGLEIDEYDDEHSIYFVLKNLSTQKIDASWRIRPTSKPYMLERSFQFLLGDRPPPQDPRVWEVSRFVASESAVSGQRFSLGDASRELLSQAILNAGHYGVSSYVWVTTVGLERLGTRLGYRPTRLGSPARIGNVLCVAEKIDVDSTSVEIASRQFSTQRAAA